MSKRAKKRCNTGLVLKKIQPLTLNQDLVFANFHEHNLVLHGLAGTGKSFISLYLALQELDDYRSDYDRVIIIRSVVPTRDIGFLPGSESEKSAVYEAPYQAICNELYDRGDAYEILKKMGTIQFMTTSFVRGVTLKNSIIIVDEINNLNFHELDSVITRCGEGCKVILCGDYRQTDFTKDGEREGLHTFLRIVKDMSCFRHIEFGPDDIVRSPLVKEYILAKATHGLT